jgi:hypothetical protein
MFDPAADFAQVVDGLQSVTVVSRAGERTVVAVALQRAVHSDEPAPSGGYATRHDCNWLLPQALLATRPELGTKLCDAAGDEWTILAVEKKLLGGLWQCHTRNVVLAHNLHARVSLEFPIYARDALGAPVVVQWKLSRANVPARIQPIVRRLETVDGAGVERATHLVYMTEWDLPSAQSRVRDVSGRVFAIERIERIDRLGELVQLHVRRLP